MAREPIADLRLLCIDDAATVRKSFEIYLRDKVARIEFASTIASGLSKFKSKTYDVALVDLILPDGNGLDIVREIRKADDDTAIIVITGHAEEEYLMEAIRLKVDHFLKKPVTEDELLDVLARTARSIHRTRELIMKNTIVDNIEDGVVAVDENRKIIYANRAAEKLTGATKPHLVGRPVAELFLEPADGEKRGDGSERRMLKSRDGGAIPVQTRGSVYREGTGGVVKGLVTFHDLSSIMELKKELQEKYTFHDIVGQSTAMRRLVDILADVADTDVNVLVTGESGTGKELVVRAIHNLSCRRDKPFVAVNCAALPEHLLESELFGYKKGAFTDAKQDKIGRVAVAEGGTLFLDEIGDMPLPLQPKILRLLQSHEYDVLGDLRERKADTRFIAATNQDLEQLVRNRRFRDDLYYRLHVVHLKIPPLRDRRDDVALLVRHFLTKLNLKYDRSVEGLSENAMEILMQHDFPGNVRELESALEHAFILTKGSVIQEVGLPDYLLDPPESVEAGEYLLKEPRVERLISTLRKNNFDREKTAVDLGIHRATLWRWLKKLERAGEVLEKQGPPGSN